MELSPLTPADLDAVLALRLRNRTQFLTGEHERDDAFFTEPTQLRGRGARRDAGAPHRARRIGSAWTDQEMFAKTVEERAAP